jgi:hypothetical protein
MLHSNFNEVEGEFAFAKSMDGSSIDAIQHFLDESIAGALSWFVLWMWILTIQEICRQL